MNERPTPETDQFKIKLKTTCGEKHWVPVEHSERLERARAEAREAAAKWESSFNAMERAGAEQARRADENREWALRAERERDEAREKWKEQHEALLTLVEHGENEIQKLLKELTETRNKMADALQEVDLRTLDFERMKQERDELLLELEEYRSIAESIGAKKAVSEKEKAIQERDEARKEAEYYKARYDLLKESW